jgi:hypothetical protein
VNVSVSPHDPHPYPSPQGDYAPVYSRGGLSYGCGLPENRPLWGGNPVADKPDEPSLGEMARRLEEALHRPNQQSRNNDPPANQLGIPLDMRSEADRAAETEGDKPPQSEPLSKNANVSGKPQRTEAPTNDLAVFGFCELWGLAFGFPPVEELYHGAAVSTRMVTFMAIGGAFAALGPTWPLIKARFPRRWSVTFVRTASDFRAWLAAFVAIFIFMYGPELYNRVQPPPAAPIPVSVAPGAPPVVIHDPATAEEIAKAAGGQISSLTSERDSYKRQVDQLRALLPQAPPSIFVKSWQGFSVDEKARLRPIVGELSDIFDTKGATAVRLESGLIQDVGGYSDAAIERTRSKR